jgi:hypothetical protein
MSYVIKDEGSTRIRATEYDGVEAAGADARWMASKTDTEITVYELVPVKSFVRSGEIHVKEFKGK